MKPRLFLFVTVYLSLCYLNIQVVKGLSAQDNTLQTFAIHDKQWNDQPDEIHIQDGVMADQQLNYFIIFGESVFLVLLLGIILYYNRVMTQKNRDFYRQIRERDQLAEQLKQMTLRCEQLTLFVPHTTRHVETLLATSLHDGDTQQQLVYRLQKHILDDKNYFEFEIDRNELVIALSTNRTTLSEAVKAVTGKTLMEYINLLRLEKAKQTLDKCPEFTVKAIAEECGFNHRTFYRLFKEHYHFSPAKYRSKESATSSSA